jgi:hypothetical protein
MVLLSLWHLVRLSAALMSDEIEGTPLGDSTVTLVLRQPVFLVSLWYSRSELMASFKKPLLN